MAQAVAKLQPKTPETASAAPKLPVWKWTGKTR